MAKAPKTYVVWKGRQPGIYTTWAECESQIKGFQGAEYMAFPTRQQAETAFGGSYADYKGRHISSLSQPRLLAAGRPIPESYAVDAACSGNPGVLEYRCVHTRTKREVFHEGPFQEGTNNVGEFLALVQALSSFKRAGITAPVYSDSEIALGWLKAKRCKTQLVRTRKNETLFDRIEQAQDWLRTNAYPNKVLKWETDAWGEIPADFGRK
jgi:ribonuclease HI